MVFRRRRGRVRTAVFGPADANAFEALLHREVGTPIPGSNGQVDPGGLGRNAHHLAAAPGNRANVAVNEIVGLDDLAAGLVDLFDRVGDLEIQRPCAVEQALGVLGQLVDYAVVGPLTFEYGAGVVQTVAEDMEFGIAPVDEFAVEPDQAVAIVEWNHVWHCFVPPWGRSRSRLSKFIWSVLHCRSSALSPLEHSCQKWQRQAI